ncbi:MAG: EAL domain-containing protein [[Clostridium] innocuum]
MDKKLNNEEIEKGVFVINQHYEIVYMDETAKQTFPGCEQHAFCYQMLQESKTPCFDCPLKKTGHQKIENRLLYNQKLEIWMEYVAIRVEWPKEGLCTLISMHAAAPGKAGSVIHAQTDGLLYAIVELHMQRDSFTMLYENLRQQPRLSQNGSLRKLLQKLCTRYVYKEDRADFEDFWNLDTLEKRIAVYSHVSGSFRILLHGAYRWMKFQITASSNEELTDTCLCLIDTMSEELLKPAAGQDYKPHYDELTRLYGKTTFERLAQERLMQDVHQEYGLVDIDIEHFKLFNDWYGIQEGDHLLMYISYQIRKKVQELNGIATRIGGDEFVMLLPQAACDVKKLEPEIIGWIQNYDASIKFLPTVGIYMIQDKTLPIAQMCDRAAIAATSRKGNYASRVAVYQDSMKKLIENRQEVLFGVKNGLDNREFVVYYQPQVSARTNRILAAEALVRWQHPQRGLLPPGEFIPILETSGFIYKLDSYVWEEVCRFLQDRLMKKLPVVPVSVNVSRVDMLQFRLCEVFTALIKKYEIPSRLLEIEITESAYAENFDQLIATVNELRACGFTVLMDDFGSGYSSLNMLSNIELDILKIDMKFLDTSNHQNTRNSSILESITSMGRWLGLRMIAEGVETHEQADRLLNLDCEYMQGYYFYKPMSRDHFCELLADAGRIDVRGMQAKRLPSIDLEDLFHKDITSEAMLSNILGGIALYEIEDDTHLQILMVNDRYYRITGCNAVDLQERSRLITRQIHPEDMPLVWDIFHKAQEAGSMGASGTFRRYRLNGELMWMHLQAFFLHKQGNRKLFYGSVSDVSTTMSLQKELLAILQTMPGDIFEYQVYPDERLSCRVISAGLSLLHGYTTQELQDILENGMLEYIDARDHDEVMRIWSNPKQWKTDCSVEFRLFTKTGETVWVEQHIRYIREEEGVRIYNSLLTDITKIKKQEDELLESQRLLHHLLGIADQRDSPRQLTKRNKEHAAKLYAESFPGGMIGGFCEKGFPLYFANEEMIHFLGYDSYQDLYQGINGMVENTIYQEDRAQVELDLGTTFREGMEYTTRYRMVQKDGSLIWVQDRGRVICEEQGRLAIISTCMNIDEIVKARQLLEKVR